MLQVHSVFSTREVCWSAFLAVQVSLLRKRDVQKMRGQNPDRKPTSPATLTLERGIHGAGFAVSSLCTRVDRSGWEFSEEDGVGFR